MAHPSVTLARRAARCCAHAALLPRLDAAGWRLDSDLLIPDPTAERWPLIPLVISSLEESTLVDLAPAHLAEQALADLKDKANALRHHHKAQGGGQAPRFARAVVALPDLALLAPVDMGLSSQIKHFESGFGLRERLSRLRPSGSGPTRGLDGVIPIEGLIGDLPATPLAILEALLDRLDLRRPPLLDGHSVILGRPMERLHETLDGLARVDTIALRSGEVVWGEIASATVAGWGVQRPDVRALIFSEVRNRLRAALRREGVEAILHPRRGFARRIRLPDGPIHVELDGEGGRRLIEAREVAAIWLALGRRERPRLGWEALSAGMEVDGRAIGLARSVLRVEIGAPAAALVPLSSLAGGEDREGLEARFEAGQAVRVRLVAVDPDRARIEAEIIAPAAPEAGP